ncbi:MAG: TolC family protein [Deltaproteobacteria bacterium]|nr:TolC family protein [Deltaproteobacteria bacterium]
MPQLGGSAGYERTTANYTSRPGSLPRTTTTTGRSTNPTFDTFDYWSFDVTASQLLYDFGQTTGRRDAARAGHEAQEASEASTTRDVTLGVRSAYFAARAAKDLVQVARETLANQQAHLEQITAFVEVGTRPEIDVVQARTDRANARVALIKAENEYATAKAQLDRAIGIIHTAPYEVADDDMPPIAGEDGDPQVLVSDALATRPDVAAAEASVKAQDLTLGAVKGGYGPSLAASTTFSDAGTQIDDTSWNWNAGLAISWPFFEGGRTRAEVREASANVASANAAAENVRQQVRLEVEQARLAVRDAASAIDAAVEVVVNAREQLRLAEGRYETGVGNVIELGDAQIALTSARSQEVQARFRLATARAQLQNALGRP